VSISVISRRLRSSRWRAAEAFLERTGRGNRARLLVSRYYASPLGRFVNPDDFLNDTRVYDPASWNLYAYVRNNPLNLIDPTGEKVNGSKLTEDQRQLVVAEWKATTGYKNIYFAEDGNLVIDRDAGIERTEDGGYAGSADARANLTDAVENKNMNFNPIAANDDQNVGFALCDAGETITRNNVKVGESYNIQIDFSDFGQVGRSDNEAKHSHSLGLVLLHEIDHHLYGDVKDTPNNLNDPGPVERTYINPIREQLGLAQRATYHAVPPSGAFTQTYRGYVQVRFTFKGSDRYLRWREDQVVTK
jgi:RHS repeat-associated protein